MREGASTRRGEACLAPTHTQADSRMKVHT